LQALARANDQHTCPKTHPDQSPHHGGPIKQGSKNVLINNKSSSRLKDVAQCQKSNDKIKQGIANLLINNKPATHIHAKTTHNGKITQGSPNVFVGEYCQLPKVTIPLPPNNQIIIELASIGSDQTSAIHFVGKTCELYSPPKLIRDEIINDDTLLFEHLNLKILGQTNQVSIQ